MVKFPRLHDKTAFQTTVPKESAIHLALLLIPIPLVTFPTTSGVPAMKHAGTRVAVMPQLIGSTEAKQTCGTKGLLKLHTLPAAVAFIVHHLHWCTPTQHLEGQFRRREPARRQVGIKVYTHSTCRTSNYGLLIPHQDPISGVTLIYIAAFTHEYPSYPSEIITTQFYCLGSIVLLCPLSYERIVSLLIF